MSEPREPHLPGVWPGGGPTSSQAWASLPEVPGPTSEPCLQTCCPRRLWPTLVQGTVSSALGSALQYGCDLTVVSRPHKVGARGLGATALLLLLEFSQESPDTLGYGRANIFPVLKAFYNRTYFVQHGTFLGDRDGLLLWSYTVSMFPLGGLLGSLVVGLLADRCGR